MNELFVPRVDAVDDGLWFETRQTAAATARLWSTLAIFREEPRPWMPRIVLAGEPGVGKTALVERFIRAAQRSVKCDVAAAAARELEVRMAGLEAFAGKRRDAAARARAEWAEDMVATHGTRHCPGVCRPGAWVPEDVVAERLARVQRVDPAVRVEMMTQPHRRPGFMYQPPRSARRGTAPETRSVARRLRSWTGPTACATSRRPSSRPASRRWRPTRA